MGMLESFEIVETIIGAPTMSVTKNGISFNKTTIEKLAKPEYAKALIDKEGKRFAIVPCSKDDRGSRPFYKLGKDTAAGVRWNNYDLRTTVESMMGWNLLQDSWKMQGTYFEEDNALIFELSSAEKSSK